MTIHTLKIWPEFFSAVVEGRKRFEVRKDDRKEGFAAGDELVLKEWEPLRIGSVTNPKVGEYSGREVRVRIDYVLKDSPCLKDQYAVLSITPIETIENTNSRGVVRMRL